VSLVLDPSMALSWYFEDECSPAADALLDRVAEDGTVVPSLWRLEIANGLQIALRRGRINRAFRDRTLAELGHMAITTDPDTDSYAWTNTLQLAERFQLTVYDAAYLELAQRRSLPLATLDKPLRAAAGTMGIMLFDAAA
jgi:predicted nucleic acid-binding protein